MTRKRASIARKGHGRNWSFVMALVAAGVVVAVGLFLFDTLLAGSGGGGGDELLGPVATEGPGTHDVARTTGGADIHFATTSADFGVVPLNTLVGYAFSLANVGDQRLEIEDVNVSVLEGC